MYSSSKTFIQSPRPFLGKKLDKKKFPKESQLVLIIYIFQHYLFSLCIQRSELKPLPQANFGINIIFVHSSGKNFTSVKKAEVQKTDFPLIHLKMLHNILHKQKASLKEVFHGSYPLLLH